MDDIRKVTAELLADKPEAEPALREVLTVDTNNDTWEFDDLSIDSGIFGELVARGIVNKCNRSYTISRPEEVRAAIGGETSIESNSTEKGTLINVSNFLPSINYFGAIVLIITLILVFALRVTTLNSVFRDGSTVLLANDPYYYRYWLMEMFTNGDLSPPQRIRAGEPLLFVVLTLFSTILGRNSLTSGTILAWYPPLSAVISAVFLYIASTQLSEDRRLGVAAVVMLAVTPVHAYRTALGFGDHHAFDYIWMIMSLLALVALVRESSGRVTDEISSDSRTNRFLQILSWRTIAWIGLLGFSVAAQALSWTAGPLLTIPVGFYILVRVISLAANDHSISPEITPIIIGLFFGFSIVSLLYIFSGWQTQNVVLGLGLLVIGAITIQLAGMMFRDVVIIDRYAIAAILGGFTTLLAAVLVSIPTIWAEFAQLFQKKGVGGIGETQSLFNTELGVIAAPILFFGFLLFVALPYGGWAAWTSLRDDTQAVWLVPASYLVVFLALAAIQVRFAGHLAYPVAVFSGLGFLHLASVLEISDNRPAVLSKEQNRAVSFLGQSERGSNTKQENEQAISLPTPSNAAYLLILFILVAGVAAGLTPIRANLLTYDQEEFEAAQAMAEYSEDRDLNYPENYVLSQWSDNRMYNWFVNGESQSYQYAESNYKEFLQSTDSERWYKNHKHRVGFVVISNSKSLSSSSNETMFSKLQRSNGSQLPHYQLIYDGTNSMYKVFVLTSENTIEESPDSNESDINDIEKQLVHTNTKSDHT